MTRPGRPQWLTTLLVMWVAQLIAIMGMSLVIPFLPLYLVHDLGVDERAARTWSGLLAGANFVCAAVAAPFWGGQADRRGPKLMTLRALLGLALAIWLMGRARSPGELLVYRLIQGALGGFVSAAIALVGSAVPREQVGGALGFLQTAMTIGWLVGPLAGGAVSDRLGFRVTFQFTGAMLLVAAALVWLLVREPPRAAAPEESGYLANLKLLRHQPSLRGVMATVFLASSAVMMLNPQLPLLVTEMLPGRADVAAVVGMVTAAPALTSMVAAPLWGRAGDRYGHGRVLPAALVCGGILHPWGALVAAPWQLILLRAGLGISGAAISPAAHALVAQQVATTRTAGAFSLLASAQMLGAAIGPMFGGGVARWIGIRPLFLVSAIVLAIAAATAARIAGAARPIAAAQPDCDSS